jgi:methyl coenzyme M reductase subunit D
MNKKYLIGIIVLAIIAIYVGGLLFPYCVKPSVGGVSLAMGDENLSEVEVILRENLPTSFTVRVSSSSPRYYTVIPSS